MDYETRFPKQLIDTAEMADLVKRMAKIAGAVVAADEVIIISTDDAEFSGVLDTLADGLVRNAPKKLEGREKKLRRKSKAPQGEKRLGLHSYRNTSTGEIVSKQKINKMLAANELARGTTFVNGHDETFMVDKVDESQPGPFQLIIVGE